MKLNMDGRKILAGHLHSKYRWLVLLIWFDVLCISCKNKDQKQAALIESTSVLKDQNSKPLPADFIDFYQKFHADSIFQMEHIDFPLKGMPDHADPEDMKDDYYYTSDQWTMHKSFDPKKFSISYLNLSDILIEEKILEKEHNLMIIRRFAKHTGGWSLIYYAGLNKYKALK